jgi:peptidoglycan/LPS O-acetylase OafA/YrhL
VAQLPLHLGWRVLLVLAGLAGWWTLAVWFGQVGEAGVNGSLLKGQMGSLAALCFAPMVAGTLGSSPASASSDTHVNRKVGPRLSLAWHAAAFWSGRLSYGVYLFHMAALQMVQPWRETLAQHELLESLGHQGVAVLLTLLMAWICHLLWEEPWRQFGRRKAAQFSATN